jgi:hypothetical protein
MSRICLDVNPKSILTKEKNYCTDVERMVERYYIYAVIWDDKGRVWHKPLSDCMPNGISSLRKAKAIHLLNSI